MRRRKISNAIIVINAGSSSIKFSLFADETRQLELFLKGQIEGLRTDNAHFIARHPAGDVVGERRWTGTEAGAFDHDAATRFLMGFINTHLEGHKVEAVGHRIVHGGGDFTAPAALDAAVLDRLATFVPLAPLHQRHNLAPARSILASTPGLFQVGCFDTAFHATQPPLAQAFALPAEITDRGVRRYGFHGLSYEYIASHLGELGLDGAKVIVAHLGNGASLCAMDGGRSVASTMGFTAVEGLPMGTRCGTLDPGVLLYLMDEMHMGPRDLEKLLYQRSGLLGVSGISSDMRTLETSPEPRAKLAVDLFTYRIGREIGSLAAALGGLDALVFTAGIGEHSAGVREAVCHHAAWLGVELDGAANARPEDARPEDGATRISAPSSRVAAWIVPTDEEQMIARHTRRLLTGAT
ncbi:acetate/propionate family kinase [Nitrospirillum viridazoti]|uniref:acetate/propionate family kinase n=1 Tax=Nitrospirillum viridazoti TaxID=3144925 RepID=UPI0011AC23F7|nr:acetate/propionate family kinase [Nitrospirillum amazonense]TWB43026.1 acetate kinase [Nitrospirillum amazonense]